MCRGCRASWWNGTLPVHRPQAPGCPECDSGPGGGRFSECDWWCWASQVPAFATPSTFPSRRGPWHQLASTCRCKLVGTCGLRWRVRCACVQECRFQLITKSSDNRKQYFSITDKDISFMTRSLIILLCLFIVFDASLCAN